MASLVERPYPSILDQHAQESHAQWGEHERQPEVADELDHRVEEIRAQGEEGAVGEVRDVQHARDDGQPDAHERVEHARGEPIENLAEEQAGLHAVERPTLTLPSPSRGRGSPTDPLAPGGGEGRVRGTKVTTATRS